MVDNLWSEVRLVKAAEKKDDLAMITNWIMI